MNETDEIAEMNKVLDAGILEPPTPEPDLEVKEDETKKEETKGTSEAGDTEEAPPEADKVTEVEEKKEEVAAEKEPEPDPRDKEIADLRAKLAEKEVAKAEVKKEEPAKDPEPEEQDFLGSLDLDDLSRDPKEFNKVMNKVYQKAVTDTRKVLEANLLKTLPQIVKDNIGVVETLRKTSEEFYEANPDLKGFKKVVATVFEEVAAQNADQTYGDIIEKVAPEVRKRLELPPPKPTEPKKDSPPKLPSRSGKAGKVQDKPTLDPLQAELEEMSKTLGR